MAETDHTVSEMFKAKTVIDDDVNRLVEAVLDGSTDQAPLAEGHAVDPAASVEGTAFAKSVLGNNDSAPAIQRSAAQEAALVAWVEQRVIDPTRATESAALARYAFDLGLSSATLHFVYEWVVADPLIIPTDRLDAARQRLLKFTYG